MRDLNQVQCRQIEAGGTWRALERRKRLENPVAAIVEHQEDDWEPMLGGSPQRLDGQRYHVGMQLASVALKGKPIPRVAALVEAMFVAELADLLLTAGHDLDQIALPLVLDAGAGQAFTAPNGAAQVVKDGDMFTADARGRVLSAVITGPSDVARISPETTAAVFYAYGPPGISAEAMGAHLDEIERNVRLISPDASTIAREIISAP